MAAGEGKRAGTDIPKQFVKLLGIPMLWWSVMAFYQADHDTEIKVVLHPGFFDDWDIMVNELPEQIEAAGLDGSLAYIPVDLRAGGRSRSESVKNGLMSVADTNDSLVAVHDAARPLVSIKTIKDCWEVAENAGNAVACAAVVDSLREYIDDKNLNSIPVDRSRFISVQTPQVFKVKELKRAFDKTEGIEFTDEASRYQSLDCDNCIINLEGFDPANIKVTNPSDFVVAEALLKQNLRKIRENKLI